MKQGKRSGRGPLPAPPEPVRVILDGVLAPFGPRPARTRALPMLQGVQAAVGWLSPEVLAYVSGRTGFPVADLTGLATFYELLATEPAGTYVLRVCDDIACSLDGRGGALLRHLTQTLGIRPGETTPDGRFTLKTVSCLGACDRGPCLLVNQTPVGPAPAGAGSPEKWPEMAPGHHGWLPGHQPQLLHRCGRPDPQTPPAGGLPALTRALAMAPDEVIRAVTASGLTGRGGAAFPAGAKWAACARAAGGQKYVVLNADESEPGTYTNRKLLEDDPWLVLEGMLVAAFSVGATRGYAYVRGEYDLAARRLAAAVAAARQSGWVGEGIGGTGFTFDVEIRRGAGAYICGEETALFASIEGYRGEPRVKPPFPTDRGLFGCPTVVHNAETLACVPAILCHGPAAFAQAPPKLFSVSGHVRRPGVYEAPLGTPLRRLLEECAGGITGRLQAVLVGGAAGMFLTPGQMDTPLTLEALRQAGATLGSGAVLVLNDTVDLWALARRLARFFAEESCGQCTPCRLGTARQRELVDRLCAGGGGAGAEAETELLADLAAVMGDASICGLGQTAAWPIQSLIRQFGLPGGGDAGGR